MAIIRRLAHANPSAEIGPLRHLRPLATHLPVAFVLHFLLFAFFLSACSVTRPVVKIGLLAPFEGVYRQEGYTALAAMRAAIAEQSPYKIDVLPLALDTSRDVTRAGQKVMADPSVAAIIGPYWAADGLQLERSAGDDRWLRPYAPPEGDNWLVDVLDRAAAFAQREGRSLVVAGIPFGWPEMDVAMVTRPEDVQAAQSVLWLGDAGEGADFAVAVWKRLPDTPIGLYGAGTEVFRQRAGPQMTGLVYLIAWIDDEYTTWAQSHTPNTPASYTVYRQTADALSRLRGEMFETQWQPALFMLGKDGVLDLWSGR